MSKVSQSSLTSEESNIHEAIKAAGLVLFIENSYHEVTLRQIAKAAGVSTSMINYYFGSKHGLYEHIVREQFSQIGSVLTRSFDDDGKFSFQKLMQGYLNIHQQHPNFPAFLINILAYQNGPGYKLLSDILDQKRTRIAAIVDDCQATDQFRADLDVDILRITMMALSVFPFLIKGVIDNSTNVHDSDQLMIRIADAAGQMLENYSTS